MRTLLLRASAVALVLCSAIGTAGAVTMSTQTTTFSQKPFTDVPSSSPYFEAIEYLRTNNILKGYMDGMYHPGGRITRAEFLQLVTNEFFLHGRENDCLLKNTQSGATIAFFPDVPRNASFATDVCVAKTRDLVHGYPDGFFRPGRPVSFVEAAKVIARIFALKTRDGSVSDPNWYAVYIDLFKQFKAIPATIDPSSPRSLSRPLTRGELAQMIYLLTQAQKNQ